MSVALDHVRRIVDGLPIIREVSLTLENGTRTVLLGPTLHAAARVSLSSWSSLPKADRIFSMQSDLFGPSLRLPN